MLKKMISRLTVTFMFTFILFCFASSASAATYTWTATPYQNIFQSALKPAGASTTVSMVAVRNEYESGQLLIRSDWSGGFTITGVTLNNLTSGTNTIASSNIKYNYVEYVYITNNSLNPGGPVAGPGGQGFPDALSNSTSSWIVGQNRTQPIWVTVYIPTGTPAGTYTGTVTVNTNLTPAAYNYTLSVEVVNATIPNSNVGNFKMMHWQQVNGTWGATMTATNHSNDILVSNYGNDRYTPQWWALLENIAKNMKEYRTNVLFVNTPQALVDGGSTVNSSGVWTFNWSRFDEVIQFFIDRGVVKGLEGQSLASNNLGYIVRKNGSGVMESNLTLAWNSAEATSYYNAVLPALKAHLQAKGWLNMWFQQVQDEPNSTMYTSYSSLVDKVRTLAPGLKIGDAHIVYNDFQFLKSKNIDVYVPMENTYENYKWEYDALLAAGKEVYMYTCNYPGFDYLSNFIDEPVYSMRHMIWAAYHNGLSGYLHWGWNGWTEGPVDTHAFKGDGYTVWPDVPNNKIKASIRLASYRDGIEDFEVMKLLQATNPALARGVANAVVPYTFDFSQNVTFMKDMRTKLLRAAGGLATPALIVNNGGVEYGDLSGWVRYPSNATAVTGNAYTGTYSVRIPTSDQLIKQRLFGLQPNTTYTATAWVKTSTTGDIGQLFVSEYDAGYAVASPTNSTGYKQMSVNFTTGPNGTTALLSLYKRPGGSGVAYFDDVLVSLAAVQTPGQVAILNPSFDAGPLPGANLFFWSGFGNFNSYTTGQRSGPYCAQMTTPESGFNQTISQLKPNTAYTLRAWVKSNIAGQIGQLSVGGYGGVDKFATTSSTTYTQLSIPFTTGATNTTATIYLYNKGTNAAGTIIYVDDVTLTRP